MGWKERRATKKKNECEWNESIQLKKIKVKEENEQKSKKSLKRKWAKVF